VAFSTLAAGLRTTRPLLPRPLVRGSTSSEYELVARVETERLKRERRAA
jgi:hypothetical protein